MNNNNKKRLKELLTIFSTDKRLVEMLELYFLINSEMTNNLDIEMFNFENAKLKGILDLKKILVDFSEEK